jgi:hypothetical protein
MFYREHPVVLQTICIFPPTSERQKRSTDLEGQGGGRGGGSTLIIRAKSLKLTEDSTTPWGHSPKEEASDL